MSKKIGLGVIMAHEIEGHGFLLGPAGIEPGEAAKESLPATSYDLAVSPDLPPWSDCPDIEISAILCLQGVAATESFAGMFRNRESIKRCESLDELMSACDAVFHLSAGGDGNENVEMVRAAIRHKRPIFVDKFLAPSAREAAELYRSACDAGIHLACSSL